MEGSGAGICPGDRHPPGQINEMKQCDPHNARKKSEDGFRTL